MYHFLRILFYIPLRIVFWFKVIDKKKLPKNNVVLVCNHTSNIDAILLALAFNRHIYFVGKKELKQNRFMKWLLTHIGVVFIDRDNVNLDDVKNMLKILKNNKVLGIFPEGTRNKEQKESLLPFKRGFESIALKTNSPVFITAISPKPRAFKLSKIYVGEPYYCKKEEDNIANIRQLMIELLNKEQK